MSSLLTSDMLSTVCKMHHNRTYNHSDGCAPHQLLVCSLAIIASHHKNHCGATASLLVRCCAYHRIKPHDPTLRSIAAKCVDEALSPGVMLVFKGYQRRQHQQRSPSGVLCPHAALIESEFDPHASGEYWNWKIANRVKPAESSKRQ